MAPQPSLQRIIEMMRSGVQPDDRAFDRFLPDALQAVSTVHWTPLAVAVVAANWLDDIGAHSVVDVGSGAGKFCVAAALAGHCELVGLEQRPRLVAAARALAHVFALGRRVSFVEGVLGEGPVPEADAYYLYNPFGENLLLFDTIDSEVELSIPRYHQDIANTMQFLEDLPDGTYVMTYNGFGGEFPDDYALVRSTTKLPNPLELWRKAATTRARRQVARRPRASRGRADRGSRSRR